MRKRKEKKETFEWSVDVNGVVCGGSCTSTASQYLNFVVAVIESHLRELLNLICFGCNT